MLRTTGALALAAAAVAACDNGTGPEDAGQVVVRFATVSESSAATAASRSAARSFTGAPRAAARIAGVNGTLELSSIHLIVGKLALEGAEGACEGGEHGEREKGEGEGEDCHEFDLDPFLLDLPLDGGEVTVTAEDVRPGVYTAFEFEVEDVEADEEGHDASALADVVAEARALHPDWPDEASMVVEGTFTPVGDVDPIPFRTFAEAEIEVESTFDTPLTVEADGNATVSVVLDPAGWFTRADGTVVDLSRYDYTGDDGDILEFEFERGVAEVEHEGDDD
ncbi:MAG TPA: hypothetical protein VE173_15650 [Longimicrobiales bacterium]|nr:hypothetical protein [Longimicrobiales bacterium]